LSTQTKLKDNLKVVVVVADVVVDELISDSNKK
jgi:hypothetical protein